MMNVRIAHKILLRGLTLTSISHEEVSSIGIAFCWLQLVDFCE